MLMLYKAYLVTIKFHVNHRHSLIHLVVVSDHSVNSLWDEL